MSPLGRGRCSLLPVLVVAACAPATPPETASGTAVNANTVVVREDLSGRFLALIGPRQQDAAPYLGAPDTNYSCLRTLIDRGTGETANQLYVAASYDEKRDWSAAYDNTGQALTFLPIGRYPIACDQPQGGGNCSYSEEFAAKFPENKLRQNPNGFAVTFIETSGGHARQTIAVSAAQVSAQLAALRDLQKKGLPAAAGGGT
jgi:hypothetical protein